MTCAACGHADTAHVGPGGECTECTSLPLFDDEAGTCPQCMTEAEVQALCDEIWEQFRLEDAKFSLGAVLS